MRPRIRIMRCADGYPADYEPQRSGAGYVVIGAFAIGLALYVLALVIP